VQQVFESCKYLHEWRTDSGVSANNAAALIGTLSEVLILVVHCVERRCPFALQNGLRHGPQGIFDFCCLLLISHISQFQERF